MANQISLRGFVSSEIETNTMDSGLVIGKFRMGSNIRRIDPITNQWVDGKTNWFRVNTFRSLAQNTMVSIHKGDRILVVGKLRISAFVRKDGTPGTGVEIDADSIGPDLQFGTASYHRLKSARPAGQGDPSPDGAPAYPVDSLSSGSGYDEEYRGEAGDLDDGAHDRERDDEDGDAAALTRDENPSQETVGPSAEGGLERDEEADKETGEISKVPAPF